MERSMGTTGGMPRPPPLSGSGTARRVLPPSNGSLSGSTNGPRAEGSSISSSGKPPISAAQVVILAREEMRKAVEENQSKAGETSLSTGVTVDLSHKQILRFPDEVVDIIKHELERLALSHNQISAFPARFAECSSLRYLNVRNNRIREFPPSICQLTSLEILDLARNKLEVLPPELSKLTSLKVLSLQKNRIETLPVCLADMTTLQILKLDGNPVKFPPKEILEPQASSPPNGSYGGYQEHEIVDVTVTAQIKRFMRQKSISDRSETESGEEESPSEGTETPRPMRRVSGRFPIKVNGTDMPDLRSPALSRPPPIPSRSHYRGLSQQNAALRRPGVMPLTIGNANERVRSNSDNILQASRLSTDRSKRMGILTKKSELGTVDETKSNRHSHYRGLSHGSAMNNNGTSHITRSPNSPADAGVRGAYVRRLSSLPERKRESTSPDPHVEGAKGVLYALFQIHPIIQNLLGVVRDGNNKRSSLEIVFYNANTHIEELDTALQNYESYSEEDEEHAPRSSENVYRACVTAVRAYKHVCSLLKDNVENLLQNSDPRYIRSLLLLTYASLAEVRNASADLFHEGAPRFYNISESSESTIRSQTRDKSQTPTRDRPGTSLRLRSAAMGPPSSTFRVAIDGGPPPLSARMLTSATPRSGESFSSSNGGRMTGGDFSQEDRIFDEIFLLLQQTTDLSMRSLPVVIGHFTTTMKKSGTSTAPEMPREFWQALIGRANIAMHTTEDLKARLSSIKLKEPGVRTQGAFWELCNAFIETYTQLVIKVKEAKNQTLLFPVEVISLLRPLQKAIKDCGKNIQKSPWAYLAAPQGNGTPTFSVKSPQVPLPMTPQSAALGPAVQATVPSTPSSAMFTGNFWERADQYLSSTSNSRTGTMSSTDERPSTAASSLSPMNSINSRFNNNGKLAF